MPTKPRVRTLMDGQHGNGTERLLKYARKYVFVIFFNHTKRKSGQKSLF